VELAFLLLWSVAQEEKTETVVIRAGRIWTVSKGVIEDGVVLIRKGKIERVGRGIDAPLDAKVLDFGKDACVSPGFIDMHSHLGSAFDTDEDLEAVTPKVRAIDAFSSTHPDVAEAAKSGVTLVALSPGDGNLIGGRIGLVRLSGGTFDRLVFRESVALKMCLTTKALARDRRPTSKAGAVELLRRLFRDADGEVGTLFFKQGLPAVVRVSSTDEIQRATALRQEFGFKLILLGAEEGLHAIDDVKRVSAGVALGPMRVSDVRRKLELPGRLSRAGVRIGFSSDAPSADESYLRVSAALAVKYGLDRDDAMRALSLWPAEMLGVADQLGSLDEGKLADIVVYGGHPLSLASPVELVLVDGRIVYQRKK